MKTEPRIFNVVLFSGVQQSESDICMYIYIYISLSNLGFPTLFTLNELLPPNKRFVQNYTQKLLGRLL